MISKKLQCRIQSLESTYVQKVKRQLDIEKKKTLISFLWWHTFMQNKLCQHATKLC